ncbi:hypothetical protein ACH5RR_018046 [Cinchona calisaya]|uniref:Uncharacterized protein n=1 Tax=Cinchona calisaya TaxID=153742 RepID=A0ABD2ZKB3_9GENT
MSSNSNATNNQTPVSSPMSNENGGQPQTSESHLSRNNKTVLIIGEHENAFENHEAVPTSGKDAQHLITKSGFVVHKIAKLNVAKWSHLIVEHRNNLYNSVLEKMKELKATTSMTTKEICEKQVGYIPGQVRARSASKKQTDEIVERLSTEIEENRRRADTEEQ